MRGVVNIHGTRGETSIHAQIAFSRLVSKGSRYPIQSASPHTYMHLRPHCSSLLSLHIIFTHPGPGGAFLAHSQEDEFTQQLVWERGLGLERSHPHARACSLGRASLIRLQKVPPLYKSARVRTPPPPACWGTRAGWDAYHTCTSENGSPDGNCSHTIGG